MREALFLFRKDVRHFRLQLAAFVALMSLAGCAQAATPRRPEWLIAGEACQWLLLPAAWYLLALAVHEQKLPGDRQYWLTRPYPRNSLLLAKALFVAVFLNLPLLATQVTALAANGLAPLAYWRALVARQFFFTALVVLPAAALAAVTTSLAQFGMGAFAAFGVVLAIELGSGRALGRWGGLDWIESSAVGALALVIFGGVIRLQYARRETLVAAAALAGGVVACAVLPVLELWSGAWAVQMRLSDRPSAASSARLRFDAARDPADSVSRLPRWIDPPDVAPLALPVELRGIPAGMAVLSERTAAIIDSPDGASWSSGWQPPLLDPRALRFNGPFPLSFVLDRSVLEKVKHQPVRLRIQSAFTLFSGPSETRLPVPAEARRVPAVGFCWTSPARFTCFSPFAHAPWVEAQARPAPPAAPEPVPLRPDISYAPYPAAAGFGLWQTDIDAMWMRAMPWKEIAIQTRQTVAHFEMHLEIPEIRLAPYTLANRGAIP